MHEATDSTATGDRPWRAADPARLRDATTKRFILHRWFIRAATLATRGRSVEVFKILSLNRRTFRSGIAFNARMMPWGKLERADTERLILRTAWRCGSDYEWGQHVAIGRSVGLTRDEIEQIKHGADGDGFSPNQRALLTACDELIDAQVISDRTWTDLKSFLSDGQILEVCLLVGNYAMLAGALNSFGAQLEPAMRRAGER